MEEKVLEQEDQDDIWADALVYEVTSNDNIWYELAKNSDNYKKIKWTYYGKPIGNKFNFKSGNVIPIWLEEGVFNPDVYGRLRTKIEKFYKIPELEAHYGLSIDELIQCITYGLSPNFKTLFDLYIYLCYITSKKEFKRNILKDPGVMYQIAMYKRVKV